MEGCLGMGLEGNQTYLLLMPMAKSPCSSTCLQVWNLSFWKNYKPPMIAMEGGVLCLQN